MSKLEEFGNDLLEVCYRFAADLKEKKPDAGVAFMAGYCGSVLKGIKFVLESQEEIMSRLELIERILENQVFEKDMDMEIELTEKILENQVSKEDNKE